MANVYETQDSRNASSIGTRGTNLRREFHVLIDTTTDDPIRTLNNHASGVGYYHPHPWNRDALAVQFSIVDRVTNFHYIVGIDYELPITLQRDREGPDGWIVQFQGATETQTLLQELLDPADSGPPKLLGTPKYELVTAVEGATTPPATATHKIAITDANGVDAFTYLRKSGGIIPFPFHRNLPAVTMTLERDIPFLTLSTVGTAATFLGKVNDDRFFGGTPGHLLFPTFTIRPLPMEIQQPSAIQPFFGSPMPWKVILTFIWHEESRKMLPLLHKHREDDGTERFVMDVETGDVVVENLQVARSASFGALLRLFPAARTIA